MNTINEYHNQAEAFLAKHGFKCRISLSNTKNAPWAGEGMGERNHYRVTLSRSLNSYTGSGKPMQPSRIVFDFWGSINDADKDVHPHAYDVLSAISSDAQTPTNSFNEFCDEFGYDADSITAIQTFKRHSAFSKRLRAFFTETELNDLAEIQ